MTARLGAQLNRPGLVMMSADESRRVRAVIARLGKHPARAALNVSEATLEAAREQGRMQAGTREKILAALDAIEATL